MEPKFSKDEKVRYNGKDWFVTQVYADHNPPAYALASAVSGASALTVTEDRLEKVED